MEFLIYAKKRLAPMVWSPLAGEAIFSSQDERTIKLCKELEEIANEVGAMGIDEVLYAWLLSHLAHIMPIVGSGKMPRIKIAIRDLDISLTRDHWFDILHVAMGREIT